MGYVQNHVSIGLYPKRVSSSVLPAAEAYVLTREDKLRARVIERQMGDFEVDLKGILREFGHDAVFLTERNDRLRELEHATLRDGKVLASQQVPFVVRAVAAAFHAYFGSLGRTHSKSA